MAQVADFFRLVRFSHSVFALPFALIAFLYAGGGVVDPQQLLWVLLCMVSARSAAMAYNRYLDAEIDARNPRTAGREIPAGVIRPAQALGFVAICVALFVLGCWMLNELCLYMAAPVLLVLLGYSHAKRFTSLAHLWLGVSLGLAPVAAWVAVRGSMDASLWGPVLLGLGVASWVMGFDILYACQDEAFDRQAGLHSIPARFGRRTALRIAMVAHACCLLFFAGFAPAVGAGWVYHVGVAVVAVLLIWEHRLVTPEDLSRVNMAFFNLNGTISFLLLFCALTDLYLLA